MSAFDTLHAHIQRWGEGFFYINTEGRISARPSTSHQSEPDARSVDLTAVVNHLTQQGYELPLLLRFPGMLRHRVQQLCHSFDQAIQQAHYPQGFTAVYPIKVNQQQRVVETIVNSLPDRVGLEVGSKTELMAVLAQSYSVESHHQELVICNGYKDREYIRLALMGQHLGLKVVLIIEQLSELDHIVEQSQALQVTPTLGVRLRLSSLGKGQWQNTGGEKSKFGLNTRELLQLIQQLQHNRLSSQLQLLHFHMGSQIADLRDIQTGLNEALRYYHDLCQAGLPVQYLDVGGGLGVDYEGLGSLQAFSMQYQLQDYADTIINTVAAFCQLHDLNPPHIITESGRALTAHHAVLVTQVVDAEIHSVTDHMPTVLQPLQAQLTTITDATAVLQQIEQTVQMVQQQHVQGQTSLITRAAVEQAALALYARLRPHADGATLTRLDEKLADKYFCNFSLFQSSPDMWGLGQVFPIVPLQRLNEPMDTRVVVHDLTCDSDGQVYAYATPEGIRSTLPAHRLQAGENYLFGVFMVGAYQEILGDLHNLFGDTHVADVEQSLCADGPTFEVVNIEAGDSVDELLRYVHYDTDQLLAHYRQQLAKSDLNPEQQAYYLDELRQGLTGYTYFED